ncbi:MAG: alpha/beta fold hydrolase [Actinomycetota bacterium]|nr:alpha/beta fold hydrolase [Actinomycetota bacterium]
MFRFNDCVLDPRGHELRRGGEPVRLERQVFAVLVHLLTNRDRVVPKAELLDVVWGNRFVSDSALTSRLKDARRAVGDDGQQQHVIATVHGVGYRFVAPVEADGHHEIAPTEGRAATQQIRFCRSPDGVRLAFATCGSGPPLVKAANWLTHLDHEWDSPIWRHWIRWLADRHHLIRYDERGCGLSDWDVDEFSLDAWVEDLELVIDNAGIEQFPLLGISQGGAVAISYAQRHPERVTRLVLIGAYSRGRLARACNEEERQEAALDLALGRVSWRRDDATFRQVFASQFLPEAPHERWEAFNELQRATTSVDNVVRFLDAFAHIDVSEVAPEVACPTLILHARRDVRVPESQARDLARLIPDSRLILLDGGNHIITPDEPAWSTLVEEVDRFLAL